MGALADAKHEWRHFSTDAPGTRFVNHRERMRGRSRWHSVLASGLGLVLLATGFVLLFMPGPGLVLIGFGVALFASHSHRLAMQLDRAEPWIRHLAHRMKGRWRGLPGHAKLGVLLGMAAFTAAGTLAMWMFVSPFVLG
jgi:hypothetical protein